MNNLCYAIDIHTHYNSGSAHDTPTDNLYQCTPSFLREEYDSSDIALGCYSSFGSVISSQIVCEENEKTRELAGKYPWFFYWVVIYPEDLNTFKQAKTMLKDEKCLGIKIHPPYHGYSIKDYGDKIFSFASEQNAVVLMHPDRIKTIPDFANKYRDIKIIVAHLGSQAHVDCIKNAAYGNVYTDTSTSGSLKNNVLEYAVSQIGAEKILFGTDTYSCGAQRGRVQFARLTDSEKEKILFKNALELFSGLSGVYESYSQKSC